MSNKLQGKDYIDVGFWDNYISGAKEALALNKELAEMQKSKLSATNKELILIKPDSVKNIEKFNDLTKKTATQIDQLTKIEAKELELQKELARLNTDKVYQKQVKEVERLRQEKLAKNKATREEVRDERALDKEYDRQSRLLNKLRKEYKNVALAKGESSREAKALLRQITPLRKGLERIDKTVGQNFRGFARYTDGVKRLTNQLGIFVGVAGAFRLLKDSVTIVRDFEKQNAVLAGVLGVTREETKLLTEQQQKLGETTEFTASEVGNLQEQYARLGFTQNEILGVTEGTLRGATALQAELGATAELVGSQLRAFDLDVSETDRVVDSLTASTQKSALNFERLKVSLAIVSPVAKNANVSLEQTLGLLGTVVDRGVDASTAGTSLRNVFLELSKQGLSLEEALNKINESTDKNGTAFELFGKRGATVGVILAENQKQSNKLAIALERSGGSAKKLAEEQLNTLDGSLKLLKSAWEGYILRLNDATNGGNTLTKVIRFLSKNLEAILGTVGKAILAFTSYKVTVLAVNKSVQAFNLVSGLFQNGIKGITTAFKALNRVTKANLIGLVVGAIVTAIAVFKDFTKELSDNEKAQRRLNKVREETLTSINSEKTQLKSLLAIAEDETRSKKEREKAITAINNISPEYLGNITLENLGTKETTKSIKLYLAELTKVARARALNNQLQEIENQIVKEQTKNLSEEITFTDHLLNAGKNLLKGRFSIAKQVTTIIETEIKQRNENIKSLENQRENLLKLIGSESTVNDITQDYTTTIDANTNATKKNTKEKKEQLDVSKEIAKLRKEEFEARYEADEKANKDSKKSNEDYWDDILKEDEKAFKERMEAYDRAEKERMQRVLNFENFMDSIAERDRRRSQERLDRIDKEVKATQDRADSLRRIAEAGNLSAQQSLGIEQRREAELALKREKEIQKQKRIEAGLALLKTYTSALGQEGATPQSAIASVLKNGVLLTGLINALPSFYEGTENTTKGNLDSKGGFLSVLHPNERVVPEKHNKHLDGIANAELPIMADMYKKALLQPTLKVENNWQSNEQILSKFEELNKSVKNLTNVTKGNLQVDYNNVENVITQVITTGNKVIREQSKPSRLWD